MNLNLYVVNLNSEPIEGAQVQCTYESNQIDFTYNSTDQAYQAEVGGNVGDQIEINIQHGDYEDILYKEFIRAEGIHVVLGEEGCLYIRTGPTKIPIKPNHDVLGITYSKSSGGDYIGSRDLIKYESSTIPKKILNKLFVKSSSVLEGLSEQEIKDLYRDDLTLMRQNSNVGDAGPIYKISKSGVSILNGLILVRFHAEADQGEIDSKLSELQLSSVSQSTQGSIIRCAPEVAYEIVEKIDGLYDSGLAEYVTPFTVKINKSDFEPGDFLWGGQYDKKVINTQGAWLLLKLAKGEDGEFGWADVVVGITDSGIPRNPSGTFSGQYNPELDVNVIQEDGTMVPKLYLLQDLRNSSFGPDNDTGDPDGDHPFGLDDHGINVAGIISAKGTDVTDDGPGLAGVAPNTRLFSVLAQNIGDQNQVEQLLWMAGLKEYQSVTVPGDQVPKLGSADPKCSVITTSTAYDFESTFSSGSISDDFKEAIDDLLYYGRKGKGVLLVASGGNENTRIEFKEPTVTSPSEDNRWSAYARVIAAGAVSYYPDYLGLRKTNYSNTGKIDFCAPSSNFGLGYGAHNPSESMSTWASTFPGEGDLIHDAIPAKTKTITTTLSKTHFEIEVGATILATKNPSTVLDVAATAPGPIQVDDPTDFSDDMWVFIDDGTNSEWVKIDNVAGNVINLTVGTPLVNSYPTAASTNVVGHATINVSNPASFSVGKIVDVRVIRHGITMIDRFERIARIEGNDLIFSSQVTFNTDNEFFPNESVDLLNSKFVAEFAGRVEAGTTSAYQNTFLQGNANPGDLTLVVDNKTGFLTDQWIFLSDSSTGNSEWIKIAGPVSTVSELLIHSSNNLVNSYNSITTTVVGFGAVKFANDGEVNLQVGEFFVLGDTGGTFDIVELLHIGNTDELIVSEYTNMMGNSLFPTSVRVEAIPLDDVTGLSDNDNIIIDEPDYVTVSVLEKSELNTILQVDSTNSRIFVEEIHKDHPLPNRKLYSDVSHHTSKFGGTSSAAPTIAGVIALMISANPNLTWVEILAFLRETSTKIDLNTKGYESPETNDMAFDDGEGNFITYNASPPSDTSRPLGSGRWKDVNGQFLFGLDGTTPNSASNGIPFFSDWYGHGMVNAQAAVNKSLNYNENWLNLMIRDTLLDEGLTDNLGNIQSPDIWIQNAVIDYENGTTSKPDFTKQPPHENPTTNVSDPRTVYARVKNRGDILANYDCYVRFYVALSDGNNAVGINSPFLFPDDWMNSQPIDTIGSNTGANTTYFLGEMKIEAGSINPGGDDFFANDNTNFIVSMPWDPAEIPPVATGLKTYLLVQVAPHDGNKNGPGAESNTNLSFREIIFADFEFKDTGGGTLPDELEIDGLDTETTDFEIEVKSAIGSYTTEKVEIKISRINSSGAVENATFKYNSGTTSWELKDDSGGTPGWCNMSDPVEISTSDPATGIQTEIKFSGDYSVDKQFIKVELKGTINSTAPTNLIDIPIGEEVYEITVFEKAVDSGGLIPTPGQPILIPDSFTFTDFADINTQTNSQKFGPVVGDETNKFRVTSSFTALTDVDAYAITSGFVMIQPGSASDRVNLILRPFKQPIPGLKPVKYFVYRELKLDEFLNPSDLTKVVTENPSTNSDWITQLYATHNDLNVGLDFLSKALGYDPGSQAGTDEIDQYFFNTDPDFQLPFVGKGTQFGKFFASGGSNAFGIDVILDDRKFIPTLGYAQTAFHEVDITGLPDGTDAEKFTKRLKQDEILSFMDLAAFYGIHHTEDAKLRRSDGSGGSEKVPLVDLYTDVLEKFNTKNTVYLDIRNEIGDSLNFFTNYDDGSGNQVQFGLETGSITAEPYSTNGWPILIKDNSGSPFNTTEEFNTHFLKLRIDDNIKPMLFSKHGTITTPSEKSKFVEGDNIHPASDPWTEEIGFKFPNTGASGAKLNIPWLLKLHYFRQVDSGTTYPATVVQTNYYLDNMFGDIDKGQQWDSSNPAQWSSTDFDLYVDGSDSGFGQASEKGTAVDQPDGNDRNILYAMSTDNFLSPESFAPAKGQTAGTGSADSFFDERLFSGYQLEFDIINMSPNINLLQFAQNPDAPVLEQNTQVLGVSKLQMDSLKALTGFDNRYPRTVALDKLGDFTDANGKPFSKFKLGVQGLDTDGLFLKSFPTTDVEVYSKDELFFTSPEFSLFQPFPLFYRRTVEERNGSRLKHASKTLDIDSVDVGAKEFFIIGKDAQGLSVNETVEVTGSAGNDGTYTITEVNTQGTDKTVIKVAETISSASAPLGEVSYEELAWEDYFIRLDQDTSITSPPDIMAVIVQNFIDAVDGVPDNDTAPGLIDGHITTYAPMILARAKAIVNKDFGTSPNPDDRILYWARIKMSVAFKSHPYIRKSTSDRNNLVAKFEDLSRGYSAVDFSGLGGSTKKVLITGYDPFSLLVKEQAGSHNIYQSNPSGASALYLDDVDLSSFGVDAKVQTVLFPVRYDDFDEGVVDNFFDPFINPASGIEKPDMIITLSQGRAGRYDLERFATKFRNPSYRDNLNKKGRKAKFFVPDGSSLKLSDDPDALDEYLETNLPTDSMVSMNDTGPDSYQLQQGDEIFNQGFFVDPFNLSKPFRDNSAPGDDNTKTTPIPPADTTIKTGSGDAYLSNEVFYRVALLREKRASTIVTGHLHLPVLQPDNDDVRVDDFDKVATKEMIEDVVQMIVDGIDALP